MEQESYRLIIPILTSRASKEDFILTTHSFNATGNCRRSINALFAFFYNFLTGLERLCNYHPSHQLKITLLEIETLVVAMFICN